MNRIEVGQTWQMASNCVGGDVTFDVLEVGAQTVRVRTTRGKILTPSRRTLERGLRRARIVRNADGTAPGPTMRQLRERGYAERNRLETAPEARPASSISRTTAPRHSKVPARANRAAPLFAEGLTDAVVAQRLGVSVHTAGRYRKMLDQARRDEALVRSENRA